MKDVFTPPIYLKSTFAQTLLASSQFRKWGKNPMREAAREVIFNTVNDVRLQGFYSPQTSGRAKGVIMLLHGWEGSADSAYIMGTGKFLYEHGYSVVRLNYRDHGETHQLNPGLFYAVLLDEVFNAVQQAAQFERELPFTLAGFSLGGNFALRIARKCTAAGPIENLAHVFSISPALDPEKSTHAIDKNALLRKYFHDKWARSLLKKQACFPDLYDFREIIALKTLSAMTDVMIERYSDYESASQYFRGYAVLGDALANLNVPTTIITAQDDPIIPVEDFSNLSLNPLTELIIHRHGGHNGFIESLAGNTWYERKMLSVCDAKEM